MRKVAVGLCLLFTVVLLLPTAVGAQQKVLLIARETSLEMEFMINNEVSVMTDLLKKSGHQVVVATASGEPISDGRARLIPDLKLADVVLSDYAGILIPCMEAGDFPDAVPEASVPILKAAFKAGTPIAAQHSLEMIGAAGLVSFGHPVATGPGVVVDGKLITSYNCPHQAKMSGKAVDTYELIADFVKALRSP